MDRNHGCIERHEFIDISPIFIATNLVKQFNLSPHPEGGWFIDIVRSKNYLIRDDGPRFDFQNFELLRNTNNTSRLDKAINDLI